MIKTSADKANEILKKSTIYTAMCSKYKMKIFRKNTYGGRENDL